MRIRLDSIGCRLNIGEMEELGQRLASTGHRIVGPGDAADLFVFNTCAVTQIATRKSRKTLRQLRRRNPDARIVATGCYADLEPAAVDAAGVDLVVSNADKDRLPDVLTGAGLLRDADPVPAVADSPFPDCGGHTRAFVKVQDGCDNRCTFCIVVVARGPGRSRSLESVIDYVRDLVERGYREVVLSGVHLGAYGHDRDERRGLESLVRRLLRDTEVERIRLSSLEPWDLSPSFFDLWDDERLQPHLHLPLQSGSDTVLQRMARRTDQRRFAALVAAARERIADLAISTDVIVGFPGETDAEFEDSARFIEDMDFSRLHVFRYSPRPGTAAARMPSQVPGEVARRRSERMHEIAAHAGSRFAASYLGRHLPVLWENAEPCGGGQRWSGLTGNFLRVVTETDEAVDLTNRTTMTELLGELPGAVYGRPADETRRAR